MAASLAWESAREETEDHCSLRDANCDHWFRRFRCAAVLHSLAADGGSGDDAATLLELLGVGDAVARDSTVSISCVEQFNWLGWA